MKARNELNDCLYRQKMDGLTMPNPFAEHAKYVAICNGDIETVSIKIKNGSLTLISDVRILSKNNFKNAIYHFVLAASSIAEACMEAGMGRDEAYTLSDIYILNADSCKTIDSIHKLYEDMCLDFAERMKEIRRESVISLHVRKCINYIYENLGDNLSLKVLAEVVNLNPAYLSKLFRQETGITIRRFIKEARIDTAQNLLRYSDLSDLAISVSLGFSSQSAFISVFKEITGTTPRKFRERNFKYK